MNRNRRKQLQAISDQLTRLMEQLEAVNEDEGEAYENLPEPFQYGERGEAMEEAMQNMEDAIAAMEEAVNSIGLAIEQ